jgi:hypothetical protein
MTSIFPKNYSIMKSSRLCSSNSRSVMLLLLSVAIIPLPPSFIRLIYKKVALLPVVCQLNACTTAYHNWHFGSTAGRGFGTPPMTNQYFSRERPARRDGIWNRSHAFCSAPCHGLTDNPYRCLNTGRKRYHLPDRMLHPAKGAAV